MKEVIYMIETVREKLERQFLDLTDELERVYGTSLTYEDEEETMITGYICPHCGDVVLFEDWIIDFSLNKDAMYKCPICCEDLEVD